jgi:hypothetical protein
MVLECLMKTERKQKAAAPTAMLEYCTSDMSTPPGLRTTTVLLKTDWGDESTQSAPTTIDNRAVSGGLVQAADNAGTAGDRATVRKYLTQEVSKSPPRKPGG